MDKIVAILKNTNDGDQLDPKDLALVQSAANGRLDARGQQKIENLYKKIINGSYEKPWFHGIEGLTIDQHGYVYWHQNLVEHFEFNFAWSLEAQKTAYKLAQRCRLLEEKGEPINIKTAVLDF